MATERSSLVVSGIKVEVIRKDIANLHLAVYPPDGRVRVAVPPHIDDDAVRLAIVEKLGWIRRQQAELAAQPRQSERSYVSGESHYFLGRRLRLQVDERPAAASVTLPTKTKMVLSVRPGSDAAVRRGVVERWYRQQLRTVLEPLIDHWADALGVQPTSWSVRHMRTKWGSCSPAGRILFNTELVKKPPEAIEYVALHELAHLIDDSHSQRFTAILDKHLPDWQRRQDILNTAPLAHEDWQY